jgi:hypothetical protein
LLVIAEQRTSRGREQHLSTVASRTDSCRARHSKAEVAITGHFRLAGVNTYPNLHLGTLGPIALSKRALRCGRRPDRVARASENHEEGFRLTIDDGSAVLGEGLIKQAPMGLGHFLVAASETALEFRRRLQIREEKGDRPLG